MKILLIDADSKIPNLALMKLSAYHKSIGDTISLCRLGLPYYPSRNKRHYSFSSGIYDKIYCSVVFDGNLGWIHGDDIDFGGTGYSLDKDLPDHIECLLPDYGIYPENKVSYGFISRGCIRNCYFCKVPKKEGHIRQVGFISDIVRHKVVKFMDNNILALPNHKEILQEIVDKKIRCSFNQGLDLRLVDSENSILLSNINYEGEYIFAFDDWSYLKLIEKKIKLLDWAKDWKLKFFVYCHPDMEISNIVDRISWLKERKYLPYIMRDVDCYGSQNDNFYKDISAWCNQAGFFKKKSFKDFLNTRHTSLKRINKSLNLYKGE